MEYSSGSLLYRWVVSDRDLYIAQIELLNNFFLVLEVENTARNYERRLHRWYALLRNTLAQAETLLHSLEQAAASKVSMSTQTRHNTYALIKEATSSYWRVVFETRGHYTYLRSSVSSTENHINKLLAKAGTAIDTLSVIWKSDLTDEVKGSIFQAAVVPILLYGCTTWTLTKRNEKKIDGNYIKMLRAIVNKSWWPQPTNSSCTDTNQPSRKLSKLDEPDMQVTAGELRTNSLLTYFIWTSKGSTTSWNLYTTALSRY